MRWSTEKRTRVLAQADAVEGVVVRFAKILLWLALAGVVALVVVAIGTRKPGGNTQGEYYYFGAAVLLVVGWLAAMLARMGARQRRTASGRNATGGGLSSFSIETSRDSAPVPLDGGAGFGRSFSIRLGDPQADPAAPAPEIGKSFSFGRSFDVPLASLPADVMPDDATLDAIAIGLARGETLDDLCEAVQPSYREWNMMARKAFHFLIEAKLEERRGRSL